MQVDDDDDFLFCGLCQIFCENVLTESIYTLSLIGNNSTKLDVECRQSVLDNSCTNIQSCLNDFFVFGLSNYQVSKFNEGKISVKTFCTDPPGQIIGNVIY